MVVVKVVMFFLTLATITETAPAADFDYLQLVQSWPPSVCTVNDCISSDYPSRFTIHGTWPEKIGSELINCPGEPFDATKIAPLIPQMEIDWIDVIYNSNMRFWAHEWNKHGTCTGLDIVDYFNATLIEYRKYNLTTVLQNLPALPTTPTIVSARVKDAVGTVPIVRCKESMKGLMLYEISLCYNNAGNQQDCTDRPYRGCTLRESI